MGRTPDRMPGASDEEETVYEDRVADGDPTTAGALRYVGPAFKMKDGVSVFNPHSPYAATAIGQILYSADGTTFAKEIPILTNDGFVVVTDDGRIVVG